MFASLVRERVVLALGGLVVLVLLAAAGVLTVVTASITTVLLPLAAALARAPGPSAEHEPAARSHREGRREVVGYGLRSAVGNTARALTSVWTRCFWPR